MSFEAWITREWEKHGIAWLVVVRTRAGGVVSMGAFLVDAWCLGVKDAYAEEMTRAEFDELLADQIPVKEREAIGPADAKRLVESAAGYAQTLGFLPHRDFRKARKVFSGLDATTATREFTFGRDGKPCFVVGPDDDDTRVNRVLAVLTARLGEDGFVFVDPQREREAELAAIDALYDFLESAKNPDVTRSGYCAEGFVTAVLLAPDARNPDAWWVEFWNGVTPVIADEETHAALVDCWEVLWTNVEDALDADAFTPSLPELESDQHSRAATEFCRGFMQGWERQVASALKAGGREEIAAPLATMRRLAATDETTTAAGRRDLAPVIAAAIRELFAATAALRSGGSASATSP